MYETLDQIIRSALLDIGEDESRYEQFLNWGLDYVREFHIDKAQSILTKKLKLTPYKTVDIPKDCVQVVHVGIKKRDRMIIFRNDPSLWFRNAGDTALPAENSIDLNSGHNYYLTNFTNDHGEFIGRMFGWLTDKNYSGYYRMNNKCTEIQFNQNVITNDSEIYLEYVSDGFDATAETLVPKIASLACKRYMNWMRLEMNDRIPPSHKRRAEELFYQADRKVDWRMNPITLEDIREVLEERFTMAPKLV